MALKGLPFLLTSPTRCPVSLPAGGWRSALVYSICGFSAPVSETVRMIRILLSCRASQMPPPLRSPPERRRVSSGRTLCTSLQGVVTPRLGLSWGWTPRGMWGVVSGSERYHP